MDSQYISNSAEETEKIGEEFAKSLKPGDVVCLYGDLGAGKTTFTKGVGKGLGVVERIISPTFSLVREHETHTETGVKKLYHIDLYRLENIDEVKGIGIEEILSDPNAIIFIEWAEKMGDLLPEKRIEVRIMHGEENERKIVTNKR